MKVRPGINADGFRTAVKDYTEPTVIEELAANSYDADASTLLVLLDNRNLKLYVIDDGIGFDEESFEGLATLGAGQKKEVQFSKGKRHYLGSYGYGIKSTLNISKKVMLTSYSDKMLYNAVIDWRNLDDILKNPEKGFTANIESFSYRTHGTVIEIELNNATDRSHLIQYQKALENLPHDNNNFNCYIGILGDIPNIKLSNHHNILSKLKPLCSKWLDDGFVKKVESESRVDLSECEVSNIPMKSDPKVVATFYFGGMDRHGKVKQIKPGLRGIYVRIHGRLLKQSFTDSKYTYNISKWKKFESGLRVEINIDWLRDQITLSREGIRFSNEKLEEMFKQVLTTQIGSFIRPKLKKLETAKEGSAKRKEKQRRILAEKRVKKEKDVVIKSLKEGFVYKPESDAELALVLCQPSIMKKVMPNRILIDYNDQAEYDCIFYDEVNMEYIECELEPRLTSLIEHNKTSKIKEVVTWSKTGWRIGAKKRGKNGYLELRKSDEGRGRYIMLEYASKASKKPRKKYMIHVIEEII